MTDPFESLRAPVTPAAPDPVFAEDLRERLRRLVLQTSGADVSVPTRKAVPAEKLGRPPALTPYIAVRDADRAIDWYLEVFDGHLRGEVHRMDDGVVGHAEIGIGDAVLMLAEGGIEGVPVAAPTGGPHAHTLHLQVPDVDAAVARAEAGGAAVERRPEDRPYGRVAALVDPFGHRWLLDQAPASASRHGHGDVSYVTMVVADAEAAKSFYGAVLGWEFEAGATPGGWGRVGEEEFGIWGDPSQRPEVQLCYKVADIAAAAEAVTANGGTAGAVERKPYGLMVNCTDNQGAVFQLWQA